MVGREGLEEADRYGMAAWIVGCLFSAGLVLLMFGLAQGFR
jgi:hypothetical protein